MADERKIVLFIAGIGRNGSTLLSRLLGAMEGVDNLGEFASYWTRAQLMKRRLPCSCGLPLEECPRWSSWKDIGLIDVPEVDRVSDNLSVFLRRPAISRATEQVGGELANRYLRAAEQAGVRLLVDASKRPALALAASTHPAIEIRLIHLVRHPESVAASWSRPKSYLRASPVWRTALRWTAIDLAVQKVARQIKYSTQMRHEDLVSRPLEELNRVLEELDLAWPPLPTIHNGKVEVGQQHSLAGNPDKMVGTSVTIRPPRAPDLGVLDRLIVKAATGVVVGRYGY